MGASFSGRGSRRRSGRSMSSDMDELDEPSSDSAPRPRDESDTGRGATGDDTDLATILSYLIRSGQVRILEPGLGGGGSDSFLGVDEDDDDDDDEYLGGGGFACLRPDIMPKVDHCPDTTVIDENPLRQQILLQSGQAAATQGSVSKSSKKPALCKMLHNRELGNCSQNNFSFGDRCTVYSMYLPNEKEVVAHYRQKAFCGTYSQDGNIFLSACQDRKIRIYDTSQGRFKLFKSVVARDVGWSVLDTAFSPDGNYLIYSSWSDCIHLCNIHGEHETHDALHLFPETDHSFCIFSLCFSQDNLEILGGANDGCLYVYDREKNIRSLKIDAHDDDVNAVAFADASSQILFSGGDDGLCKVWDRRTLREEDPVPVGVMAGHSDGIAFIDTKGDGRYLISNSKDQSIKLWDMRKFSSTEAQKATKQAVANQKWDYRWQDVPSRAYRHRSSVKGDTSLMTYRGHSVLNTLIRCHFSPMFTTGQRYIYSGCASGAVVVYDVLTGKIESRLDGHRMCVRDVSWHPYDNQIISSSWDGFVVRWKYCSQTVESDDAADDDDDDSSESDSDGDVQEGEQPRRRSLRLRNKRRAGRSLLSRFMRS